MNRIPKSKFYNYFPQPVPHNKSQKNSLIENPKITTNYNNTKFFISRNFGKDITNSTKNNVQIFQNNSTINSIYSKNIENDNKSLFIKKQSSVHYVTGINKGLNNNNKNNIEEDKINKFSRNTKIVKINENISSYNNSQISQKTEVSYNTHDIIHLSNKNIKNIKIKKIKELNDSFPEIKGQVSFDKMKKRKNLFKKSESNIDYFPNYKFIMPRSPTYIFKYIRNKENYKKYINGKIIRGYKFDPENYYVMKFRSRNKSF